jgi:hypothetical protein
MPIAKEKAPAVTIRRGLSPVKTPLEYGEKSNTQDFPAQHKSTTKKDAPTYFQEEFIN